MPIDHTKFYKRDAGRSGLSAGTAVQSRAISTATLHRPSETDPMRRSEMTNNKKILWNGTVIPSVGSNGESTSPT